MHGSVQVVEETQEPERRDTENQALRVQRGESVEPAECGLEKICAHKEKEGRQLQIARHSQKEPTGQELRGEPLDAQYAAVDKDSGRQHAEPIGREPAQESG